MPRQGDELVGSVGALRPGALGCTCASYFLLLTWKLRKIHDFRSHHFCTGRRWSNLVRDYPLASCLRIARDGGHDSILRRVHPAVKPPGAFMRDDDAQLARTKRPPFPSR